MARDLLGTTVLTRCPYWTPDQTEITYAVSDCTLIMDPRNENTSQVWWTDPDMPQCPKAPFSMLKVIGCIVYAVLFYANFFIINQPLLELIFHIVV